MRKKYFIILTLTTLFNFQFIPQSYADECIVGVAIGTATKDGRPILWKNSDTNFRDNEIAFFVGPKYDFIGIINANDTTQVWAGINTAGFAIMNSESLDLEGDSVDTEGFFMKQALGECGNVDKFEQLLREKNKPGRGTKSNFGVIDAYGRGAIFETGNHTFTKFDASDWETAPYGFIVRSNFALTGKGRAYAHWRYQRAFELFATGVESNELDIKYVLQTIARDLKSYELDPYPLPFQYRQGDAPKGFINTNNCINRHGTASCVVFHGVKFSEDPKLSTMWCILGESICGVAIPLWACAGPVPPEVDGEENSAVNKAIQKYEELVYSKSNFKQYADTHNLALDRHSILTKMLSIENDFLNLTKYKLDIWRDSKVDIQLLKEFEFKLAKDLLRTLR